MSYDVHRWYQGQTVNVTVKNTGKTAWAGWKLAFTFPGTQRITGGWSAHWRQTGHDVTATNLSWNHTVKPGGTVHIGFTASGSGPDPTAFTVDGKACRTG